MADDAKTKKPSEEERRRLDRQLDEGLEESFPGSDPVNIVQPSRTPADKEHQRRKGER